MLVQMERQIDREIAADQKRHGVNFSDATDNESKEDDDSDSDIDDEHPVLMYGPLPQIVTNDLKSLDEMVSRFSRISFLRFQQQLEFKKGVP